MLVFILFLLSIVLLIGVFFRVFKERNDFLF